MASISSSNRSMRRGARRAHRIHIEQRAAHREFARAHHLTDARVAGFDQPLAEGLERERFAYGELESAALHVGSRQEPLHQRVGCDDQAAVLGAGQLEEGAQPLGDDVGVRGEEVVGQHFPVGQRQQRQRARWRRIAARRSGARARGRRRRRRRIGGGRRGWLRRAPARRRCHRAGASADVGLGGGDWGFEECGHSRYGAIRVDKGARRPPSGLHARERGAQAARRRSLRALHGSETWTRGSGDAVDVDGGGAAAQLHGGKVGGADVEAVIIERLFQRQREQHLAGAGALAEAGGDVHRVADDRVAHVRRSSRCCRRRRRLR